MNKLILYPFTKKTVSLLYTIKQEHPTFFSSFMIYGVAPEATRLKAVSEYNNRGYDLDISLVSVENIPLNEDNVVFMQVPFDETSELDRFTNSIVALLERHGKPVILDPSDLLGFCAKEEYINPDPSGFLVSRPMLNSINIPVIGVCAVFPFSDTSEITTSLKKYLGEELAVSTVYTGRCFKGWNVNHIDMDYLQTLSFENRILYTNWYLNQVVSQEKSDILIVEIPGSVMGLNNRVLLGGGEFPFIFTQAVGFDYIICSVPANDTATFSFAHLTKHLETRFGMRHISFHISNQYFFFEKESYNEGIPHMLLSSRAIAERIAEARIADESLKIYNFLNDADLPLWRKRK